MTPYEPLEGHSQPLDALDLHLGGSCSVKKILSVEIPPTWGPVLCTIHQPYGARIVAHLTGRVSDKIRYRHLKGDISKIVRFVVSISNEDVCDSTARILLTKSRWIACGSFMTKICASHSRFWGLYPCNRRVLRMLKEEILKSRGLGCN
jgi:hypothetical protein